MRYEFPHSYAEKLNNARNIYVIANNPWLSQVSLSNLKPTDGDVLVQFNNCIHFECFRLHECSKIYVFREDDASGAFWGFSSTLEKLVSDVGNRLLVFVFNFDSDSRVVEKNIRRFTNDMTRYSMVSQGAAPPSFEAVFNLVDGGRVLPTTGYLTLRILHEYLSAVQAAPKLIAVGFSGNPIALWGGHQISHEREWLRKSGIAQINHSRVLEFVHRSLRLAARVPRGMRKYVFAR